MTKKHVSPIMTWTFWSILVLAVFLLVTWEYFVAGFARDASNISWLILGFFIYGFVASFLVALHLELEFRSLKAMDSSQKIGSPNSSDIAAMFDAIMERFRCGEYVEVRNLVSAYAARLKGKVDNISVIAGMLITIGLLGTVVGLIITVSGLDQVLQSSSGDFDAMKAGLSRTVSGMGTAFYTTFFGALLGGVVLKVLGAEMKKSALTLVAEALRFGELFVAPKFQKKSSESLDELAGQLRTLGVSFGSLVELIDSKQTALAGGLDGLVTTVDKTVKEIDRLADKRLQILATRLSEAGSMLTALISQTAVPESDEEKHDCD